MPLDDPALAELLGDEAHDRAACTTSTCSTHAGHPFDEAAVLAGDAVADVLRQSRCTNFGVEPFLHEFLELAPEPAAARSRPHGVAIRPTSEFTGFVFKIQANMDPKHRDRIAFVRICSGRFEAGMHGDARAHRQDACASRRRSSSSRANASAVDEAWPGDVIGVHGPRHAAHRRHAVDAAATWCSPASRASRRSTSRASSWPIRMKRKQLDTGLRQLDRRGRGAGVLHIGTETPGPTPIVGAVGMLQFDVMLHRLEHEYGAPCRIEKISARYPRWVVGPQDEIERIARDRGRMLLYDAKGQPAHSVRGFVGTSLGARAREGRAVPRSRALNRLGLRLTAEGYG